MHGLSTDPEKPGNRTIALVGMASSPWQRIHVAFVGLFIAEMFLLVADAHSKWPEVVKMNSTTATKTVEELRKLFSTHGLPEQLVSDNGPQFVAEEFRSFMRNNDIKHIRSTPYQPATNDLAERFVQTSSAGSSN